MKYRYLLLDHDGVLVDTEFWYYEATRRALAELGVTLDRAAYRRIMVAGRTAWELAADRGIAAHAIEEQRRRRNTWYREYLVNETIEISGVVDVLRDLAGRLPMAIVTTARAADFELIHRERDIVPLMDFVLTREDYTRSKPDPEPYRTALGRFGARPSEALVVEDSERGLRAARAAGIDCAVVHNAFTADHDFSGAAFRLAHFGQLPAVLGF